MKTGRLLAFATLLLAYSCSTEEDGPAAGRPELRLTSSIEAVTRGNVQSTEIAPGETVFIWVTDAKTGGALYKANALTVQAGGALSGGTPMYFPQTGNDVNIAALHGLLARTPAATAMPASFGFTVADDQSEAGGVSYVHSDLLYAAQSVQRTKDVAALKFYHMLSKLELKITKSPEVTDAISAVSLDDVALGGTFTPAAGADLTDQSVRAAMIGADDTNTGDMTLGAVGAGADGTTNDAIIVPQGVGGKTLTFTLASGGKLVYTIPDGKTFKSGKKHVYNIELKLTGLEVTSTIEDWGDGDTTNGDATLPVPPAKIGDYFYSDGTYSATLDPAKTVVGIVFQTDPARIGQAEKNALKAQGVTSPHGLVMALKTVGDHVPWGDQVDEELMNCWSKAQNYNEISGYSNCMYIKTAHEGFIGESCNYAAFSVTDSYNAACPVAGATTGWYLPASGQWWDILQNLGGCAILANPAEQTSSESGDIRWSGQGDIPAALNAWMADIPADRKSTFYDNTWYWTSSELSDYQACSWGICSNGDVSCFKDDKASSSVQVRPVLAF